MVQSLLHRFCAGLEGRLLLQRILDRRVEGLAGIMLDNLPVFNGLSIGRSILSRPWVDQT